MTIRAILATLALSSAAVSGPVAAQFSCAGHHVLVSGYFSNNVAIFDACSGEFLRQLDDSGRIRGAQAVRLNPMNGLLYVVSEGNDQILRYDGGSYEFVDQFAQLGVLINPTGVDFGPDGDVYVASYGTDAVLRLNGQTGAQIGLVLPSNGGLDGPDNGMVFGPDGRLYVPGYDSSSVARVDPASGQLQAAFVPGGSGGLVEARGILFEPGGESFLVTGEGSGAIHRYRTVDGAFVERFAEDLIRPTGIALAPNGELLVYARPNHVYRYNRETGQRIGTLILGSSGGISGGTFLSVVPNAIASIDASQIGSQYWVFGSGPTGARRLDAEMVSANGGVFGSAFDPSTVVRKRWGRLSMEFTACDRANFSIDASGPDSAGFGTLSYPMVRLVDSDATLRCRAEGFEAAVGKAWMSGAWYGLDRSGEGVVIEIAADGIAVASFYTHLPDGF